MPLPTLTSHRHPAHTQRTHRGACSIHPPVDGHARVGQQRCVAATGGGGVRVRRVTWQFPRLDSAGPADGIDGQVATVASIKGVGDGSIEAVDEGLGGQLDNVCLVPAE